MNTEIKPVTTSDPPTTSIHFSPYPNIGIEMIHALSTVMDVYDNQGINKLDKESAIEWFVKRYGNQKLGNIQEP